MEQHAPFRLYIAGKQYRRDLDKSNDLIDDDFEFPPANRYVDENGFDIDRYSFKGVKIAVTKNFEDLAERFEKKTKKAIHRLETQASDFKDGIQDKFEKSEAQEFSDISTLKGAISDAQKEFNLSAVVYICSAGKTDAEIEEMHKKCNDDLRSYGVITILSEMSFERFIAAWQRESISLNPYQVIKPKIVLPQVTCVIKRIDSETRNVQSEVRETLLERSMPAHVCYIENNERFVKASESKKMEDTLALGDSMCILGNYSFNNVMDLWPRDAFHIAIYNEANLPILVKSVGSVREVAEILAIMKANKSDKSDEACASMEYRYFDVSSQNDVVDQSVLVQFEESTSLRVIVRGYKDSDSFNSDFINEQMLSNEAHTLSVNLTSLTKHIGLIITNAEYVEFKDQANNPITALEDIYKSLLDVQKNLKTIDGGELSFDERNKKMESLNETISNSLAELKKPNCLSAIKLGFQEKLQADINNFQIDKLRTSGKLCNGHDAKIKCLSKIKEEVGKLETEKDGSVSEMLNLLRKMSRLSGEVVRAYLKEQQILGSVKVKAELVVNPSDSIGTIVAPKKAVVSQSGQESQENLENWAALQKLKHDAKRQYPADETLLNQLNPFLLRNVFNLIDAYYYLVWIVKHNTPSEKQQNLLQGLTGFITALVQFRHDINAIKKHIKILRSYFDQVKESVDKKNKSSPEIQTVQNILNQIDKDIRKFDKSLISQIETSISLIDDRFKVENHKIYAQTIVEFLALSQTLKTYGITFVEHAGFVGEINTKNIAFDPVAVNSKIFQQTYTETHNELSLAANKALSILRDCIENVVGREALQANIPKERLILEITGQSPEKLVAITEALKMVLGSVVSIQAYAPFEKGGNEAGEFKVINRPIEQNTCAAPLFRSGRHSEPSERNKIVEGSFVSIEIIVDPRGLRWETLANNLQRSYREQLQKQNPPAIEVRDLNPPPVQTMREGLLLQRGDSFSDAVPTKASPDQSSKRLKYQRQSSSILTSPSTWLAVTFLTITGGILWKAFAFSSFSLVLPVFMCLTAASMAAAVLNFLACGLSFEEKMIDSEGEEVIISETAMARYFKDRWEWVKHSPVFASMFILTAVMSMIWVIVSLSLSLPGFSELIPHISHFLCDLFPIFDLVVSNATLIANIGLGMLALLFVDLSMRGAMLITGSSQDREVTNNEMDHPTQVSNTNEREATVGSPLQQGYNPLLTPTSGEDEKYQQPNPHYNPFISATDDGPP